MLEILPDANHVLKDVAGDSPADNLVTYRNPDLSLAEAVVPTIAGLIRR